MSIERIIVGTDFSKPAAIATAHAMAIAAATGAEVRLVHAMPSLTFYTPYPVADISLYDKQYREIADNSLTSLKEEVERWRGKGVELSLRSVTVLPVDGILLEAEEFQADLIVVGTHGRTGLSRFILGSIAEKVARAATCDVLIARGAAPKDGYRKLVVPTDFSDHSALALERANQILNGSGSIDLLHCWQYPVVGAEYWGPSLVDLGEEMQASAQHEAKRLVDRYDGESTKVTFHRQEASPRHGIHDYLSRGGFDLVVMGSHGRTGVKRLLLGSVAEAAIRQSPVSVYIAREPASK